jgi:hypothetical protein
MPTRILAAGCATASVTCGDCLRTSCDAAEGGTTVVCDYD